MIEINYTVIIQVISFLALIYLLNTTVYRPIREILHKRKEEMRSAELSAKDWNEKADTFSRRLDEDIVDTQKRGLKEKQDLKEVGLQDEKNMLQQTYMSVEEKISQTREELKEKLMHVSQSLQSEVEAFSQELAQKILGRGI